MQTNGKHFESSINLRRIPDMWHIQFNPVEYIDFGDVINVAVEVWSWKLCQIKDSLAFDAAICGNSIQQQHDVLIHLTEDCSAKGQ